MTRAQLRAAAAIVEVAAVRRGIAPWAALAEALHALADDTDSQVLHVATPAEVDSQVSQKGTPEPAPEAAPAIRRQLVGALSAEGMSTRAIAPAVGVRSDQTVRADLAQVRDRHAPEPEPPTEPIVTHLPTPAPAPIVDEIHALTGAGDSHRAPTPAPTTGLDGKTYTRPAPMTGPSDAEGVCHAG